MKTGGVGGDSLSRVWKLESSWQRPGQRAGLGCITVYLSRLSSPAENGNHTLGKAYLPSCECLVTSLIVLGNMPGWDVGVGGVPGWPSPWAGRRS